MDKVCIICGKIINPIKTKGYRYSNDECDGYDDYSTTTIDETYYYENREDEMCYCEKCGSKFLKYTDYVDGYVRKEAYKEEYDEDEVSLLDAFDINYVEDLEPIENEYDWDAVLDDMKLGLL